MFDQQHKTTESSEDIQDTLAAEWESFEKLIQAGQDELPKQEATEQADSSTWSSEFLKKPAESGHVTDRPIEVRQKRVFREVESDSDVNSNADSEDDSHPTVGVNSKVDRQSSSSDSSPSPKNNLGMGLKSASSDSDSSSDDEQPAEQTKVPLGKCDFSIQYHIIIIS